MDGFIPGSRAPLSLDIIMVILIIGVPTITVSLLLVRWWKLYHIHKWLQITVGLLLFAAIIFFEVDIRLHGWRARAEPSVFYETLVLPALMLHLLAAVPTLALLAATYWGAFKNFARPPQPGRYSIRHRRLGRFAYLGLLTTAITGIVFYWLAFVA